MINLMPDILARDWDGPTHLFYLNPAALVSNTGDEMREHGPWKIKATREIHRDPWVTVTQDDVVRPDGLPGAYTVVQVKFGVSVLAVDDDGTAHLTEEFRYAIGRPSLEA